MPTSCCPTAERRTCGPFERGGTADQDCGQALQFARYLGAPTGKRLQIMGMSHLHYKNGKIVDEYTLYDEMSLLMQVKLAQMGELPS